MRATLEKYVPNWEKRFLWAFIMGALFTIIGYGLPYIRDQFFDNQEYIKIENPITTDLKVYKQCAKVKINTRITSQIDTVTEVKLELILVREDSTFELRDDFTYPDLIIKKGEQGYGADLQLPCDIEDGIYLYQGVLKYKIHGIQREFYFYTGRFHVRADGILPAELGTPLQTNQSSAQPGFIPNKPDGSGSNLGGSTTEVEVNNDNRTEAPKDNPSKEEPEEENNDSELKKTVDDAKDFVEDNTGVKLP